MEPDRSENGTLVYRACSSIDFRLERLERNGMRLELRQSGRLRLQSTSRASFRESVSSLTWSEQDQSGQVCKFASLADEERNRKL